MYFSKFCRIYTRKISKNVFQTFDSRQNLKIRGEGGRVPEEKKIFPLKMNGCHTDRQGGFQFLEFVMSRPNMFFY
jgi:hypothetical protein